MSWGVNWVRADRQTSILQIWHLNLVQQNVPKFQCQNRRRGWLLTQNKTLSWWIQFVLHKSNLLHRIKTHKTDLPWDRSWIEKAPNDITFPPSCATTMYQVNFSTTLSTFDRGFNITIKQRLAINVSISISVSKRQLELIKFPKRQPRRLVKDT